MCVCLDKNDWGVFNCQCCGVSVAQGRAQANEIDQQEAWICFVCMFVGIASYVHWVIYVVEFLHSATLLRRDSLMYFYKMYEKRAWPFSVIGPSFSSPIRHFLTITQTFTPQTFTSYYHDRVGMLGLYLLCLQMSQFCSGRPVFMVEFRFTDSWSWLIPVCRAQICAFCSSIM